MAEILAPKAYTVSKKDVPTTAMGGYRAQWVEWAGYALAMEVVPKGFPPGGEKAFQGLPSELCQCPHWGYLVKGRAGLRLADGTLTEINAGDFYYAPPGHRIFAIEDFENIEFNPAAAAKQTMDTFASNIRKQGG
jgi:hypothetical protein